jgi:hypothetical protein
MNSIVFNNETYLYEFNKCSDGYAVRLILPNDHWITKYIYYSGHLYKTINDEKIPVECMMSIDDEFIEKYNNSNDKISFKYEINFAKKPLKYWQPDYSYGVFSRYGNIAENTITKIGWFIYTRTYNEDYDKEEIETSVTSILQTIFDIEKEF